VVSLEDQTAAAAVTVPVIGRFESAAAGDRA